MRDYIYSALPFIAIGIVLVTFFSRKSISKKSEGNQKDYSAEGMSLGMCLGCAIGATGLVDFGTGLSLGLLIGMCVGMLIKKENEAD